MQVNKQLFAYASENPIPMKGNFTCDLMVGRRKTTTDFLVIKGQGIPLLSKGTDMDLGVLQIGLSVAAVCWVREDLK